MDLAEHGILGKQSVNTRPETEHGDMHAEQTRGTGRIEDGHGSEMKCVNAAFELGYQNSELFYAAWVRGGTPHDAYLIGPRM